MLSNYEKVLEFNKAFGVTTHTEPQLDIFEKDPKLVAYRMSLVTEEFQETLDAVNNKDFKETIDGLADSLFVIYGFYTALGLDANSVFDIVHKSNMSKLCKTEQEAQHSVELYEKETPQRYDTPAYRKADDNIHWVVYNVSTKKILKSYKYTPANFDKLLN